MALFVAGNITRQMPMYYLKFFRLSLFIAGMSLFGYFVECSEPASEMPTAAETETVENWNSIVVTASAYNSLQSQGTGNVNITAWGDTLRPEIKSIAVSEDLIAKGLTYKTKVTIQGLDGIYTVNDKMHPRWKNKIDIYMGTDREKALKWGRKKVEICFLAGE